MAMHRRPPARDLLSGVRNVVKVRIPTPLRSYTGHSAEVDAAGSNLAEILAELDGRYPGLRFRIVDEQGNLRQHMRIFVNAEMTKDLASAVTNRDVVSIVQALSGG